MNKRFWKEGEEPTFKDKKSLCKCGHNHIVEVGDNDEKRPYIHYERLLMCYICKCEKWSYDNLNKRGRKEVLIK